MSVEAAAMAVGIVQKKLKEYSSARPTSPENKHTFDDLWGQMWEANKTLVKSGSPINHPICPAS